MIARGTGPSGAECEMSGVVPIYAYWSEDIYFFDPDGAAMDLTVLTIKLQFRRSASQTSADVTLSTGGAGITLVADEGSVTSIARIGVEASDLFSSYDGDMIADLIAIDGSGNATLYAHGVVTMTNNPVAV
jgi:hypothetical protein